MGFDSFDPHENHGKNLGKTHLSLANVFARLFAKHVYLEALDFQRFAPLIHPFWQTEILGKKKEARGFLGRDQAASMGLYVQQRGV